MSLTYGFYNSINGDRAYNALQMSSLFDGIINDGIFESIGDTLFVIESETPGMSVIVGTGRAWFNHTWTNNDSALPLTIDQSEISLNRIDAVVLEVDMSDGVRANSIKVIKGTPASSPVNPTLTNTELIHQHPLCYIAVNAGVTQINQANITNKVGTGDCPFITGVLETVNIDSLLSQWEDEFTTWFNTIGDILDENAAGNLLNMITSNDTAYVAGKIYAYKNLGGGV